MVAEKRKERATISGKEIVDTIIKKMKTGHVESTPEEKAAAEAAAAARANRCSARRCPLRWTGFCPRSGPFHDLQEHLTVDHHFEMRKKLPREKRFCTSSGLEEPKEWGHLVTVRGQVLAYVIGYQPTISKTHGFVVPFCLKKGAGAVIGPLSVTLQPVSSQETVIRATTFTWSEVPHFSADLEEVACFFPVKLLTPRVAEGKPHERAVEVTLQCEGPQP
mmetsp:Transcript_8288/g.23338  ORF Transcript_8288/g.23338 Transcript_8288/m.23338 type:complete len:220 (-) Transcript_8288:101-760(-)